MSRDGFDISKLLRFSQALEDLKGEAPAIIEELVVGEGVYAVKQAKLICKNDSPDIVDTGTYRLNWHCGDKAASAWKSNTEHDGKSPKKSGADYKIDVYNNLDYAKHLEYGFRSHFVPAKYLNASFISRYMAEKGLDEPPAGIYVGPKNGYVNGRFVLKRAIRRTQATQQARLSRKWEQKVRRYLAGRGFD